MDGNPFCHQKNSQIESHCKNNQLEADPNGVLPKLRKDIYHTISIYNAKLLRHSPNKFKHIQKKRRKTPSAGRNLWHVAKTSTPKSQYDQSTYEKDLYRLRELCTATLIGTKNLVPQLLQPTVS